MLGDGLQRGWGEFHGSDDLIERSPGRPPEPSGDFLPSSALADADVVIVPALAVDSTGTRLGQGGGWYDRALADARDDAPLVALTFSNEFYDAADRELPREPHDVTVGAVITPDGITRLPK
jgi:5-formyltetrahydrofolate cyclo-ligase